MWKDCEAIIARQRIALDNESILLNRQSPPESTPLESCRVAPYVNLATVRSANGASQDNNINSSATTTTGETGGKRANNVFNAHPYLGVVSGNGTISAFDPAIISAAAHQYAAAIGNTNTTHMFSISQYPLNLAAIAVAHSKSSSIADLQPPCIGRMKKLLEIFSFILKSDIISHHLPLPIRHNTALKYVQR
uniref:OAR domain-containing protein n=1 Tax=Glossina morsitans morsitans TaxID=37546 RepID=A0A1B0FQ02_GLOMM